MKFSFFLLALLLTQISFSEAGFKDRDRDFRRGRGGNRGNERSIRPPNVNLNRPNYGGNGCPDGTMRAVFAPDNLSFSILFDKFIAEVGDNQQGRGGKRDAMNCDLTLPVQIPAGTQMEITRVDYRGFVGIPQGARANLNAVVNFMERRGGDRDRINIRYQFTGPLAENYEISSGVLSDGSQNSQTELSPCGGDVQLRIRNQITIVSPGRQQGSVTLDSIDGSANAVYYVNWRQCQEAQPEPNRPPFPRGPGRRF